MAVAGRYFDGASSRRAVATLVRDGDSVRVEGPAGELHAPVAVTKVWTSSRIGNTPRFVRFPDGGAFETDDNDAIDALLPAGSATQGLAHRLESHLRFVLVGLAVTVAFVWASITWGVPELARVVAFALPTQVNQEADRLVLKILDEQFFEPTTLSESEQARLAALFAPLVTEASDGRTIRVLFRDAEDTIDANALALPAGTIVFTDQLVRLAEHDEELLGVLAHEIGHVVHRHGMRRSIQASTMTLLAAMVVGDVSSVSSAVTALPLILTELGYSRDFEREADLYAVDTLRRQAIDAGHFARILGRLDDSEEDGGAAYLSTHPPTPERIRLILGS